MRDRLHSKLLLVALAVSIHCGSLNEASPPIVEVSVAPPTSTRVASVATDSNDPPTPPAARDAHALMPFVKGQAWTGTYTCAQGLTDLVLRIERVEGLLVEAVFEFEHKPSSARGSFHVRGTYDPRTLAIALIPGDWIKQPAQYVTVGLEGNVGGHEFWGQVTNPTCSTFALHLPLPSP